MAHPKPPTVVRAHRPAGRNSHTSAFVPRACGRHRFWCQLELYLEFWAIAREPLTQA